MAIIFLILISSSLILFILGLIKPRWVPQFTKREKTRKRAAIIYGLTTIVIFLIAAAIPSPSKTIQSESQTMSPSPSPEPNREGALPKCFKELHSSTVRQTTDQPDDNSGYQVHVLYVLPSDRTDQDLDTNGTIATSVSAWENWLCNQTGGKTMRLDTNKGALDITYVRLLVGEKAISTGSDLPNSFYTGSTPKNQFKPEAIEFRLKALGFDKPNKLYAVYYDGESTYACGQGGDQLHSAFAYMHGRTPYNTPCRRYPFATDPTRPKAFDIIFLHEVIHTLGFVPACSPHHTNDSGMVHHTTDDPFDILAEGTGPIAWLDNPAKAVLDYNHDDYYDANIPGCLDLKNSAFLTGGGSELPPGW